MPALAVETLLNIWEVGQQQHPVDRALTILAATYPDMSRDELARLSIGQRDARLLRIYEQTFDPQLVCATNCPQCQEALEFVLLTAEIRPADDEEPLERDYLLQVNDYTLHFRLPNSFDLAAIARQTGNSMTARHLLLERCVLEATYQGEAFAVADLAAPVTAELVAQMARLDPQAEIVLNLDCPACRHTWSALLDIVVFLWSRITAQAKRLLHDVHTLARAYGWREADILAMSATRRQFYLDIVMS